MGLLGSLFGRHQTTMVYDSSDNMAKDIVDAFPSTDSEGPIGIALRRIQGTDKGEYSDLKFIENLSRRVRTKYGDNVKPGSFDVLHAAVDEKYGHPVKTISQSKEPVHVAAQEHAYEKKPPASPENVWESALAYLEGINKGEDYDRLFLEKLSIDLQETRGANAELLDVGAALARKYGHAIQSEEPVNVADQEHAYEPQQPPASRLGSFFKRTFNRKNAKQLGNYIAETPCRTVVKTQTWWGQRTTGQKWAIGIAVGAVALGAAIYFGTGNTPDYKEFPGLQQSHLTQAIDKTQDAQSYTNNLISQLIDHGIRPLTDPEKHQLLSSERESRRIIGQSLTFNAVLDDSYLIGRHPLKAFLYKALTILSRVF